MAKKKTHRRRHTARGGNPPRKHHRRRRINPPGLMRAVKGVPAFALGALVGGAIGVGAKVIVRKVRGGIFKKEPATIIGSVIEATTAIVGGALLAHFTRPHFGQAFAQGGIMAPMESEIQQLGIPHVSDSLGDDGFLVGPGTGVTLVSAYPADYADIAPGAGDAMGRYVTGGTTRTPLVTGAPMSAMQGYVAGGMAA